MVRGCRGLYQGGGVGVTWGCLCPEVAVGGWLGLWRGVEIEVVGVVVPGYEVCRLVTVGMQAAQACGGVVE